MNFFPHAGLNPTRVTTRFIQLTIIVSMAGSIATNLDLESQWCSKTKDKYTLPTPYSHHILNSIPKNQR
jgi:hypothetical protein